MKIHSLHKGETLELFSLNTETDCEIPYLENGIKAGFPSAAGDFIFDTIDLNKELIQDPDTTFLARVSGNSMIDMRIHDGDLILVDRARTPNNGAIAVCVIDGEFTLKRLQIIREENTIQKIFLVAENEDFKPIEVSPENDFTIWGILTHNIIKFI